MSDEEIVADKYIKEGYYYLCKGFPDFIFYRIVNNKPIDIKFREVKSLGDKLSNEQKIFKEIANTLKLDYAVLSVDNPHKIDTLNLNQIEPKLNQEEFIIYNLEIDKKKWEKFKDSIPRSITPNEKINEFIDIHIKKNKGGFDENTR